MADEDILCGTDMVGMSQATMQQERCGRGTSPQAISSRAKSESCTGRCGDALLTGQIRAAQGIGRLQRHIRWTQGRHMVAIRIDVIFLVYHLASPCMQQPEG
jgi:hypothetical protein